MYNPQAPPPPYALTQLQTQQQQQQQQQSENNTYQLLPPPQPPISPALTFADNERGDHYHIRSAAEQSAVEANLMARQQLYRFPNGYKPFAPYGFHFSPHVKTRVQQGRVHIINTNHEAPQEDTEVSLSEGNYNSFLSSLVSFSRSHPVVVGLHSDMLPYDMLRVRIDEHRDCHVHVCAIWDDMKYCLTMDTAEHEGISYAATIRVKAEYSSNQRYRLLHHQEYPHQPYIHPSQHRQQQQHEQQQEH